MLGMLCVTVYYIWEDRAADICQLAGITPQQVACKCQSTSYVAVALPPNLRKRFPRGSATSVLLAELTVREEGSPVAVDP